jgi:hypothetical protein
MDIYNGRSKENRPEAHQALAKRCVPPLPYREQYRMANFDWQEMIIIFFQSRKI